MDNFDPLSNVALGALLLSCWALVPGMIAGLLLREYGRGFWRGFALGAVCGPVGVVFACALLAADNFRRRQHLHHRRRLRAPYYQVPLFGRLHFTTVWSFAGLAVFLCAWTLCVVGYAYILDAANESANARQVAFKPRLAPGAFTPDATTTNSTSMLAPGNASSGTVVTDDHAIRLPDKFVALPAANAPPRDTLRESFTNARNNGVALFDQAQAQSTRPEAVATAANQNRATGTISSTPTTAPTASANAVMQAAAAKPTLPTRTSGVLSEVMQSLAARGHRVHATLSGEGQASTLALTCSTLTRAAGDNWLGNSTMRQSLRASGIRVVVMLNGRDSWTYIL